MRPRHRFLAYRHEQLRTASQRGATMVEYALVFSLIAVVSLAAIELLTDSASNEIDNQAECISDRPPPEADCGFAAVPEEIVVPDPGFSPPVSAPPVEADRPTVQVDRRSEIEAGVWTTYVEAEVMGPVQGDPPVANPQANVTVVVDIEVEDAGGIWSLAQTQSCVTQLEGTCELMFVPTDVVEAVRFRIVNVASNPPPATLPDATVAIQRP